LYVDVKFARNVHSCFKKKGDGAKCCHLLGLRSCLLALMSVLSQSLFTLVR
jgi:hypothetical protein